MKITLNNDDGYMEEVMKQEDNNYVKVYEACFTDELVVPYSIRI